MAHKTIFSAVAFNIAIPFDEERFRQGYLDPAFAQMKITKDDIKCECGWSITDNDNGNWHFTAALEAIVENMQDNG